MGSGLVPATSQTIALYPYHDPVPSGEDAAYLWWLRDELTKQYVGPDSKIKPEFLP